MADPSFVPAALTGSDRRLRPTAQFPNAVSRLQPTDAQIQRFLSSGGAALAALLAQAGSTPAAAAAAGAAVAAAAAAAASVSVRAELVLNLRDPAEAVQATAAQAAALARGAHTAAVQQAGFSGAAVIAEGGALVERPAAQQAESPPPPPPPPLAAAAPAAAAACEACFPGVECIVASIVEQAMGAALRCGACPAGYSGARSGAHRFL